MFNNVATKKITKFAAERYTPTPRESRLFC